MKRWGMKKRMAKISMLHDELSTSMFGFLFLDGGSDHFQEFFICLSWTKTVSQWNLCTAMQTNLKTTRVNKSQPVTRGTALQHWPYSFQFDISSSCFLQKHTQAMNDAQAYCAKSEVGNIRPVGRIPPGPLNRPLTSLLY